MVGVGLPWVDCGSVSCQRAVVKKHICLSSSPALWSVCATSGKLFNFAEPQFSHLQNGEVMPHSPPHVC